MDVIICYNGKFFGWELKRSAKEKPTKLQEYNIRLICEAGGKARLVNPENFEESLKELIEDGRRMEGHREI